MLRHKLVATLPLVLCGLVFATVPAQARFLQTDPVGYSADANWYAYVGNDPTNRTDPSGLTDVAANCAGQSTCRQTVVQTVNVVSRDRAGNMVVGSTLKVTTNFTLTTDAKGNISVAASSTVENVSGKQYSAGQLSAMGSIAGKMQQAAVLMGFGQNTTQMVTAIGVAETVLGSAAPGEKAAWKAPSVNPMQLSGGRGNMNLDHNIQGAMNDLDEKGRSSDFDPRSTYGRYSDGKPGTMSNWDAIWGSLSETVK